MDGWVGRGVIVRHHWGWAGEQVSRSVSGCMGRQVSRCVDVCVKAQSWHWESLLLTEEEPLIELRVAGYG